MARQDFPNGKFYSFPRWSLWSGGGGGGVGTRPWWLALLACGGAYRPLALGPSAMTSTTAGIRTAAGIHLPGGASRMQLLPMAWPDQCPVCGHHENPRLGGAHHNHQRECHTRPWVLAQGGGGGPALLLRCKAILMLPCQTPNIPSHPSTATQRARSIHVLNPLHTLHNAQHTLHNTQPLNTPPQLLTSSTTLCTPPQPSTTPYPSTAPTHLRIAGSTRVMCDLGRVA